MLPKVHQSQDLSRVASYVLQGRKLNVMASIESARSLWNIGGIASWNEKDALNVVGLLVCIDYVRSRNSGHISHHWQIVSLQQKTVCLRSNRRRTMPHFAIRLCGHWHNTKPFATGAPVRSLTYSHCGQSVWAAINRHGEPSCAAAYH